MLFDAIKQALVMKSLGLVKWLLRIKKNCVILPEKK